jgi:hypothetical protein
VLCDPIIPDNHRPLLPFDTYVKVGSVSNMIIEELEEGIGFFLL